MRKISIIGSGINGLVAAHGLLQQGHEVTLYSARSADDWITKFPPTGTAARFSSSLDLEEELGLNHWDDEAPAIQGVHLTFCHKPNWQLIDLMGRLSRPARAIDVRLQSYRWTLDFEARGGKVVIGEVSVGQLDEIAQKSDLTLVAAGKGEIGRLFARDDAKSVYSTPQRKLTMMVVRQASLDRSVDGIPFLPVKFNFMAEWGEQFSIPYLHKDGFACWNVLFEAKPGKALDVFDDCNDGQSAVARAKEVFRERIPWDYEWFQDAELADPRGWLKGSFTPCVREPVALLPSGRPVMALGDTANALDPIGGQGANNGYRQIRVLLDAVKAHEDRAFDEDFMRETFQRFYDTSGRHTNAFNNLLLEEITPAARSLLIAQYGSDGREDNHSPSQQIANRFIDNFDDPNSLTPALLDQATASAVIREVYQASPVTVGVGGLMRVATGQLRQALGLPRTSHPLARMTA